MPKVYWADVGLGVYLSGLDHLTEEHLENIVLHDLGVWRDSRDERAEVLHYAAGGHIAGPRGAYRQGWPQSMSSGDRGIMEATHGRDGPVRQDRVTRLTVAGLRRIESCRLDTQGLTVLIGDNGSGKSTLIEAAELLWQAAYRGL